MIIKKEKTMVAITEDLNKEIEVCRKEVKQLRREISDMLESARSSASDKLSEGKRRFTQAMGSIKDKAVHAYSSVRDGSSKAVEKSRSTITKKPLTALLIAFASGALVSKIAWRNAKTKIAS
jgi:ElaB/YqjD/DUF883 family membrane-anchored ribosome-binding protein